MKYNKFLLLIVGLMFLGITNVSALDDGIYTISTALNNNKVIDIPGGNIRNENTIQLYSSNNTVAQQFFVTKLNNGNYSIRPYGNYDYSLDVPGAKNQRGIDIQLYKYNGSKAQQWIIKETEDGYYNIFSSCNNLALDVKFGVATNETKIWQYSYNNSAAQKFKFNKVNNNSKHIIEDGFYFINASINNLKSLDVGGGRMEINNNVQLYDLNYSLAQKWKIVYLEDGYYKILCDKDNSFALTISDSNVLIDKYQDLDSQKWMIINVSGKYTLLSKSGQSLALEKKSTLNETNIVVNEYIGDSTQKFILKKTADGISEKVINNGIYRISSSLNNNLVVDLAGGTNRNGTNVQLYQSNGTRAQKWKIEYQSNGYYKITSFVNFSKSFDMAGGTIKSGANIQIYDSNGTQAQQWIIKETGDGYYSIISNCGGLSLDVGGGTARNGSNIQLWESNNTYAQKFKLINAQSDIKVIDVSAWQEEINWSKVANSGIYGAIIKFGSWKSIDKKAINNIKGAIRNNMPYGVYWFSYSNTTNGANTELSSAKSVLNQIESELAKDGMTFNPTLGIYYDLENWKVETNNVITDSSYSTSKEMYDKIAKIWIEGISSKYNNKYDVKIYANLDFYNNRLGPYCRSKMGWIAYWGNTLQYDGPYSFWQYTNVGRVNGISGNVDISYMR